MRVTRLALAATAAALMTGAAVTPAARAADAYDWAALGDSYTAGVFVGEPRPPLGAADRDGCDRTANSYPDLVARELAEFPPGAPVRLTDVSCGGAAIDHIAGEGQRPVSPVDPPNEADGWSAVEPQVQRAGLGEDTDVVTVGVGGGSLPFAGLLAACLQHGTSGSSCQERYENPPADEEGVEQKFARVQDEYVRMLAEVHEAAPNARVITVGYPAVLPQASGDCATGDPTELLAIVPSDVDWLRGVLERLNRTIQQVGSLFGDRYVDVYSSSVGHDACQAADDKWVEGVCGDAEDFWPTALNLPGFTASCPEGTHATLVHPNARGYTDTARHVERAIRLALLGR